MLSPSKSGRIKYADPRDLPSFPSTGLGPGVNAASIAASLGWNSQSSQTQSAPTNQPSITSRARSASTTAVLASEKQKTPSLSTFDASSASARAAMLAASPSVSRNHVASPKSAQDGWGSSAAAQAFSSSNRPSTTTSSALSPQLPSSSSSPPITQDPTSLSAAKSAGIAASSSPSRPRSLSSPINNNNTNAINPNALSAAAIAHRPSTMAKNNKSVPGGATPFVNMPRSMYTSHPPVQPEIQEQHEAESRQASALALARSMYNHQQRFIDAAKSQASQNNHDDVENSTVSDFTTADDRSINPVNLQEAAYKLAQERLKKLHEELQRNKGLQDYYGNTATPPPQRRFLLKTTSKLRRRSSSTADADASAVAASASTSTSIPTSMSHRLLTKQSRTATQPTTASTSAQENDQQRQRDRDALLEAARRNVRARIQSMDEKLLADTGKVAPSLRNEWEIKAQAAAHASHQERSKYNGQVDVGGGTYVDQSQIDALAQKNVQPLIDDVRERARVEKEKREELERQRAHELQVKETTRQAKEEEKELERLRRKDAKEKREEERRARRQSKPSPTANNENQNTATTAVTAATPTAGDNPETSQPATTTSPFSRLNLLDTRNVFSSRNNNNNNNNDDEARSAGESMSPTSKVKTWLRSRLTIRKDASDQGEEKGFVGGIALRNANRARDGSPTPSGRATAPPAPTTTAALPRSGAATPSDARGPPSISAGSRLRVAGNRSSGAISSVSDLSSSTGDEARDAVGVLGPSVSNSDDEDKGLQYITPPASIPDPAAQRTSSPGRDSRFREIID